MSEAGFFSKGLLSAIPSLRAFARSLGASPDRADDLVQETLIKAWANQHSFVEGTNLTKQAQTYSTGGYRPYADGTPNIMRISWSGMRIRTGVTFKFQ